MKKAAYFYMLCSHAMAVARGRQDSQRDNAYQQTSRKLLGGDPSGFHSSLVFRQTGVSLLVGS